MCGLFYMHGVNPLRFKQFQCACQRVCVCVPDHTHEMMKTRIQAPLAEVMYLVYSEQTEQKP